jgi:RNA polymerase sigma-70 factor (ECF subfamily)
MSSDRDFENLATKYYRDLYRFAFSLSNSEPDAADLTQQTFYLWATKGSQIRNAANVKSWLFTTLHREFLQSRRRQTRFPHHELEEVADELPQIESTIVQRMDAAKMVEILAHLETHVRAPLILFYMEDLAYKEIAEILEIPLGTVQSRIARGKAQLYRLLTGAEDASQSREGESNG